MDEVPTTVPGPALCSSDGDPQVCSRLSITPPDRGRSTVHSATYAPWPVVGASPPFGFQGPLRAPHPCTNQASLGRLPTSLGAPQSRNFLFTELSRVSGTWEDQEMPAACAASPAATT